MMKPNQLCVFAQQGGVHEVGRDRSAGTPGRAHTTESANAARTRARRRAAAAGRPSPLSVGSNAHRELAEVPVVDHGGA